MDDNNEVLGVSFASKGFYNDTLPPEPPEEFAVKAVRYNSADGSADITLLWNSKNRNPARKTQGYNIYMSDAGINTQHKIHLQNTEGIIQMWVMIVNNPIAMYMPAMAGTSTAEIFPITSPA